MTAVHCLVHGTVQGVGFRASCAQQAERLGVHGWVRNLPNGTVEVQVEGEADAVQQLVDWLRQGPRWGSVDRVDVEAAAPGGHDGFSIR